MKKKMICMLIVCSMLTLSACGKESAVAKEPTEVEAAEVFSSTKEEASTAEKQTTETEKTEQETTTENSTEANTEQTQMTTEQTDSATLDYLELTEGELQARREYQQEIASLRDPLFLLPNGKQKTEDIMSMDRQIIENNAYGFYAKKVCFIGDSITEGITASVDTEGDRISYPEYAADALHIGAMLNHGRGGRMFTDYGGEEYSITTNFGNVINNSADIFVVFAGVNDYLTNVDNKRFGDIYNKESTAGYCGAVRYFMRELKSNLPDKDVFFVMMYPIDKVVTSNYSDITTQPTLDDYLDVQRTLAAEYGFQVIDLYKQGFMDCTTQESKDYYLRDGLHPKDNGNIALGTHIAAELSLYYGQHQD